MSSENTNNVINHISEALHEVLFEGCDDSYSKIMTQNAKAVKTLMLSQINTDIVWTKEVFKEVVDVICAMTINSYSGQYYQMQIDTINAQAETMSSVIGKESAEKFSAFILKNLNIVKNNSSKVNRKKILELILENSTHILN